MADIIKIGGNNNGFVKGVTVDNSGAIFTTRNTIITQFFNNEQIRDTEIHRPEIVVNLANAVFISLRVKNTLDQDIILRFYSDLAIEPKANSTYLYDSEGKAITLTIPANSGVRIITSEDVPCLPYLHFLHLSAKVAIQDPNNPSESIPTTGNLTVESVVKG